MEIVENRRLYPGQKVKVYVNLNKQGRFSIVDTRSGLVCAYVSSCLIEDAIFHSSESGRKKVRETKRKMVHAWGRGTLVSVETNESALCTEPLMYNPYIHEGFTDTKGHIITSAPYAFFDDKKVFLPNTKNSSRNNIPLNTLDHYPHS